MVQFPVLLSIINHQVVLFGVHRRYLFECPSTTVTGTDASKIEDEASGSSFFPPASLNEPQHLSITTHRFNGNNYLHWSQGVLTYVVGKGKEDYLNGLAARPSRTESKYITWYAKTNMVKSWLINSMTPDIGQNYLLFPTAVGVWEAVKSCYSSRENTASILQINGLIHELQQGDMNIAKLHNMFIMYWPQLDLDSHEWKCTEDAATYRKLLEEGHIYTFLLAINPTYDNVRGCIMST